MKKTKRLKGIWIMAMTLLSLAAFTAFYVAQMWLNLLFMVYFGLMAMQFTALIIYLWGEEKISFKPLKILYHLFCASSILVLPSFIFIFMGLISQYHVKIPESIDASNMAVEQILPGEETTIYNTGKAYIIFPKYSEIDLVCENRPSKSDKSITWCSGAAFQHTVSLSFSQINVEGDHACDGVLYESPYNKDNFAAFVFYDGTFKFEFDNQKEIMKEAAEAGGSGFMQFALIRDKEIVMNFDRPRARCYRTLAELNGNVCIIDSVNMVHFTEFMEELQRLGVTNAIYMDMGAGWNYSWYRRPSGKVNTLFGLPVPWSHNWVVFRD
ncbi:hypothetical protein [Butyrivibrio proteoclasticus]|uniref:hypothetical protein n=1 Tax=Butyrivibrio proteoclasticus TaxID=43305 RepID=UPI00047A6088|nr:hypothetical protein [Butyrivibrio proteoclasticus]